MIFEKYFIIKETLEIVMTFGGIRCPDFEGEFNLTFSML